MITLESTPLFRNLPPEELAFLCFRTVEMSFAPGQEIFREGDASGGVFLVQRGEVQISALVAAGSRRVLSQVPPGEIFGEMGLLDDQPRSACATAAVETAVLHVSRPAMEEVLQRSPALALSLAREIATRLRDFNRRYLDEVLQAERIALVGRFAASIIHDIKNPLAIISFSAEMASRPEATPEHRKRSEARILKEVDRLNTMVTEILEFTRGTPSPLAFETVDYGFFLKAVVEEFQVDLERRGIQLCVAGELPALDLSLDAPRLGRVFQNLFGNAADALPQGGRIQVRAWLEGDLLHTEVQDSGPGIPPEIADRLFEAFATHGKNKGTGLGLSIARRIVEDHGGSITARNVPEGGACFTILLPLKRLRG